MSFTAIGSTSAKKHDGHHLVWILFFLHLLLYCPFSSAIQWPLFGKFFPEPLQPQLIYPSQSLTPPLLVFNSLPIFIFSRTSNIVCNYFEQMLCPLCFCKGLFSRAPCGGTVSWNNSALEATLTYFQLQRNSFSIVRHFCSILLYDFYSSALVRTNLLQWSLSPPFVDLSPTGSFSYSRSTELIGLCKCWLNG